MTPKKQMYRLQGFKRSWINWEIGMTHIYSTDTVYKISSENLLYSSENSTLCCVMT